MLVVFGVVDHESDIIFEKFCTLGHLDLGVRNFHFQKKVQKIPKNDYRPYWILRDLSSRYQPSGASNENEALIHNR